MSMIIEVPLSALETGAQQQNEPGCMRAGVHGQVCGRPRAEGSEDCEMHRVWHLLLPQEFQMLPYPEDAAAVQDILAQMLAMLLRGQVSLEQVRGVCMLGRVLRANLWS